MDQKSYYGGNFYKTLTFKTKNMLRLILDMVQEYQEALKKENGRGWIGNERLQEMEHDFDTTLNKLLFDKIRAYKEDADNFDNRH